MSLTNCLSWTEVTIRVKSSMAPMYRSIPYSSSAKPSPFPSLAPVLGSTATDPITIKSTLSFASKLIGFPYLATPAEEQASCMAPRGNIVASRIEKKPVLSRG
eukprot:Gb_16814 [translate_table: standard]